VLHLPRGGGEDKLFPARNRRRNALPAVADAGEQRREAEEVVLAPDLKWVVVALGAFQAHSEKNLTHRRAEFRGLGPVAEDHGRAVAERAALGGDQLADKLVIRFVLAERVAQPRVEVPHGLDAGPVRVGPKQVGPLVRPEVGVLGPLEQAVDQLLPLIGARVREEGLRLVGRRQPADRPQVRPPVKRRVARRNRRQ